MDLSWIDWGTAPAWISAAGTGVALVAPAYIILRDRRDKHRADAYRVACWADWTTDEQLRRPEPGEPYVLVQAKNASDRPVFDVTVLTWSTSTGTAGEPVLIAPVLKATEGADEGAVVIPFVPNVDVPAPAAVAFRDADGRHWIRDLGSQTLYRRHVHRRRQGPLLRLKVR
ncbi:hypothetical protein ABT039_22200 [Streptomyces lasiicapitis]|uniref:hypothetical protein n=1 Tax=Streptomyces lasiicapitis TaxID=1923961 RepID=UPI0033243AAB